MVSTIAGDGHQNMLDGQGTAAEFYGLGGMTIDSQGNLYVVDRFTIRKIDPSGNVTTFAGNSSDNFADGTGGPTGTARFSGPSDVAADALDNLYVADTYNSRIRKVDTAGNVTTLAGNGTAAYQDGPVATAQFISPTAITVDSVGNVYVGDGARIRKIDLQGNVSTLAGDGTPGFMDGPPTSARFRSPRGLAVDGQGIIYVADSGNGSIRKIDLQGNVSTLAGNGVSGYSEGQGSAAQFDHPYGILLTTSGDLVVADRNNNRIRKVDSSGNVTTLAGTGTAGFQDGPLNSAMFQTCTGIARDSLGNVFVADWENYRIRKITP